MNLALVSIWSALQANWRNYFLPVGLYEICFIETYEAVLGHPCITKQINDNHDVPAETMETTETTETSVPN